MNAVMAEKSFRYLRPNLNQTCIQIQGSVASWTWEMGGTNERPDFATRSGNELRQFRRLHAASDYSRENRLRLCQFDLVGHTGCWANDPGTAPTRRADCNRKVNLA